MHTPLEFVAARTDAEKQLERWVLLFGFVLDVTEPDGVGHAIELAEVANSSSGTEAGKQLLQVPAFDIASQELLADFPVDFRA